MKKSNIFDSARKLNELLEKECKYALVRNGKVVGFITKKKKKKKRGK